jgi:hypothetical protein
LLFLATARVVGKEVVGMAATFDAGSAATGTAERGALGRYGEDVAARQLQAAGLTILARNWRCREGEVDIVALDGDVLVMCEVKTRRGVGFGTPSRRQRPRGCVVSRADGWPISGPARPATSVPTPKYVSMSSRSCAH